MAVVLGPAGNPGPRTPDPTDGVGPGPRDKGGDGGAQPSRAIGDLGGAAVVALGVASCSGPGSGGGTSSVPIGPRRRARAPPAGTAGGARSSSGSPAGSVVSPKGIVRTARVEVHGKLETVLTDRAGRTLYYYVPDEPTRAACQVAPVPSGKPCGQIWPPLILPQGTPSERVHLPGVLGAQADGNERQVECQGHPLYTYAGDTGPGQARGEGVEGKWFVATFGIPSLLVSHVPRSTPGVTPAGSGGSFPAGSPQESGPGSRAAG